MEAFVSPLRFHDGSFSQAVTRARHDLKLLVVYLHSEHARHAERVCSSVLADEVIRGILDAPRAPNSLITVLYRPLRPYSTVAGSKV